MNKEKYEKLISDISNFLENSASQIEPLGFAHNIYNDPCAVEIAIKNKPIRLSLKFKKNELECCINLRPYSKKIGCDNSQNIREFKEWVRKKYQLSPKNKSQPYFKPFGEQGKKTQDIFFDSKDFTKKEKIKPCPEFQSLNEKTELNFLEAIKTIIEKIIN